MRVVWGAPLLRDAIQTLETLESGEKDRFVRVHVRFLPAPPLPSTPHPAPPSRRGASLCLAFHLPLLSQLHPKLSP